MRFRYPAFGGYSTAEADGYCSLIQWESEPANRNFDTQSRGISRMWSLFTRSGRLSTPGWARGRQSSGQQVHVSDHVTEPRKGWAGVDPIRGLRWLLNHRRTAGDCEASGVCTRDKEIRSPSALV